MKTLIISAAALAAATVFTAAPANAQIGFGVPGFGVQIGGGPYYGGYGYGGSPYSSGYGYAAPYGGYGTYYDDEPVVVQRRVYSGYDEPVVRQRVYRQRSASMGGCRTFTVQRPNGMMKRVRRCS